jgi:hypothetical protein
MVSKGYQGENMFRIIFTVMSILLVCVSSQPVKGFVVIQNITASANMKYGEIAIGVKNSVRFYAVSNLQPIQVVNPVGLEVIGLEYSPDQEKLAVVVITSFNKNGPTFADLQIWDAASKQMLYSFSSVILANGVAVRSIWNYDGSSIALREELNPSIFSFSESMQQKQVSKTRLPTSLQFQDSPELVWSKTSPILVHLFGRSIVFVNTITGVTNSIESQISFIVPVFSPIQDKFSINEFNSVRKISRLTIYNSSLMQPILLMDIPYHSLKSFWLYGMHLSASYSEVNNRYEIFAREDKIFSILYTITDFQQLPVQMIDVKPGRSFLILSDEGRVDLRDVTNGKLLAQLDLMKELTSTVTPTTLPTATLIGTPLPEGGSR